MGNKLLKNNVIQEESSDEIYILLQINNPSGIVSKRLSPVSLQNSNAGTFRYYSVCKYLYEMLYYDVTIQFFRQFFYY